MTEARRLRVLFVARREMSHPRAGDSETVVDEFANGLVDRGHDVGVLCARPSSDHTYPVYENGGDYAQYLRAPSRMRRRFADHDVVVDIADGMPFFAGLWTNAPTVCVVNHLHTVQWGQWFSPRLATIGRRIESQGLPAVYRNGPVVASSPSTQSALVDLGVKPEAIRIVPAGARRPNALITTDEEPLFVGVGPLVPHRRFDSLLRAWDLVRPHTGGHLILVGDGPERARLVRLAGDCVQIVPWDPDLASELLGRAWALLNPTMIDGWGLTIKQAAAAGTPTIGFDVPGVRDWIEHDRTGLLASTEEHFVAAWIELGTDIQLRNRLSCDAEGTAISTWDRAIDLLEAVLNEATFGSSSHDRPPTRRRGRASGRAAEQAGDWRPGLTDRVMSRLDEELRVRATNVDPQSRREIFRLFLREKHDPEPFYRRLAERSVADLPYELSDRRILDLGCGRGYYTEVLRRHGAQAVGVDFSRDPVLHHRVLATKRPDGDTVAAPPRPDALSDGGRLPFPPGSFDGILCSNLLEHTPEPEAIFDEVERVLRPGGWAWISWTNWYSPWGGHDITPLHYLGPDRGLRAWRRLYGEPRTNVPYDGLWPIHVGPVLRSLRRRPGLTVTDAHPRYYPTHRWILAFPGLREVATWNCVIHVEREGGPDLDR